MFLSVQNTYGNRVFITYNQTTAVDANATAGPTVTVTSISTLFGTTIGPNVGSLQSSLTVLAFFCVIFFIFFVGTLVVLCRERNAEDD